MSEFFGSIWWLLVALGILVTFHEYGHFWVARRFGVKVLRFSVGFGKPLWTKIGKDGTEYVIAALPLGGYVKMLDEREGNVPPELLSQAFTQKPVMQRIAIVAAGPIFNIIFALAAFWLMYVVGITEVRPVVGTPSGIAAAAGMVRGDEIISVDGTLTPSWSVAAMELLDPALSRRNSTIEVKSESSSVRTLVLPMAQLGDELDEEKLLDELGVHRWIPKAPLFIHDILEGSAASDAKLEIGDEIVALDEHLIDDAFDWRSYIQQSVGQEIQASIKRNGMRLDIGLVPRSVDTDQGPVGRIGAVLGVNDATIERYQVVIQYSPWQAIAKSFDETLRQSRTIFKVIGHLVTAKISPKNLSGPISIASFARYSANQGFERFLQFLAFLSINLAVLNLLPIPVLDGGHLMFYFIELVKGRPVSEQTQMLGQYVGMAALAMLMGLAFYNDLFRLLFA